MIHHPAEQLTISNDQSGRRLDNVLMTRLPSIPKSRIHQMIRSGEVRINKGRCKSQSRVNAGDVVRIPPRFEAEKQETPTPLPNQIQRLKEAILFEDDALLVLNKPNGIAVHGGTGIHLGVIETLRHIPGLEQAELAHRLDRDTSGCLLIAKKPAALKQLHDLFRLNQVSKRYLAVVHGSWSAKTKTIDLPLLRYTASNGERFVKVHPEGKHSITHFKILASNVEKTASALDIRLETGRTHQIRVHTQHVGHPIVGDQKYPLKQQHSLPKNLAGHLLLHAHALKFKHPSTNQTVRLTAPQSETFSAGLRQLNLTIPL